MKLGSKVGVMSKSNVEMENNNQKAHPFSTDRAITTIEEDQLNRAHFAEALAASLSTWSEKDSLVVAIYGKWGDGKTSVKNMLAQRIRENSQDVEFLEFNPWQWSHSESLAASFFRELQRTLSKNKASNQELIKKWQRYSEYLSVANDLLTPIQRNIQGISTFLSFCLIFLSAKITGAISYILFGVAILFFIVSFSVSFLSWLSALYLRFKKARNENPTLEDLKRDLSAELKKSEKTFLIIVDDIDRLNPDETKDIFTLIKANADFPNLIYLTMFQRDVVEKSLEANGIHSGHEYLEKIIQVGLDLPDTPPEGIHQILFNKLQNILDSHGGDSKFSSGRWSQLFNEGIGFYFKNLRDVNRFISSLSFQMGALFKHNNLEVNFIDLIGIEVLRQHEVSVYKALFENKDVLTASSSSGLSRNSNDAKKQRILDILKLSTAGNEDNVRQIIEVLFPNTRYAWSNYHVSISGENFIDRQICHPDRFNRYFSFFATDRDFSEYEFQHFLNNVGDAEKLMDFFKNYERSGRLEAFIEKLEFYKQAVPAEHAIPFLSTMFKLGDLIDEKYEGMFHTSAYMTLKRVIVWYLKKRDFASNRSEVFKEAIRKTDGFSLPIIELFDEYQRRNEDQYPDLFSMKPEEKEEAKDLLVNKILTNKDSDNFKNSPHLYRILWTWKQIDPQEVSIWVKEQTKSDEFLVDFSSRCLMSKTISSSGYDSKTSHYLSVDSLNELFENPKQIVARLMTLRPRFTDSKYELLFNSLSRAMDEQNNPDKYKNRFRHDDFEDE